MQFFAYTSSFFSKKLAKNFFLGLAIDQKRCYTIIWYIIFSSI